MPAVLDAAPDRTRARTEPRSAKAAGLRLLAVTAACLLLAPVAFAAGGGGGGGSMGGGSMGGSTARPKSPEEIAQTRYAKGLKLRDRALAFEEKARVKDESWVGKKPSEKAIDAWNEAIEAYQEAIAKKPGFHEAYSDMGFAHRKLGDYEKSLAAYDRALALRADYSPAIEYRAEAYLRLGRLDDAKEAYVRLFALDRPLADQLMATMKSWAESGDENVPAAELDSFRSWLQEREQMAGQVGGDVSDARSW